jgi:cytosine deaminase
VKTRAHQAILWEVAQGTGMIRSHVDVCDPRLVALRALLELRDEMRDVVDLRLIAFPQDGILSFPNGKELMREAMRLGCDVIGGIPHYEWTHETASRRSTSSSTRTRDGQAHRLRLTRPTTSTPLPEVVAARTMRDGMQAGGGRPPRQMALQRRLCLRCCRSSSGPG